MLNPKVLSVANSCDNNEKSNLRPILVLTMKSPKWQKAFIDKCPPHRDQL